MGYFYGTVRGRRGEATRCGTKDSGMETACASWEGAVRCNAYFNEDEGEDWVHVILGEWEGRGEKAAITLYHGPIGRLGGKGVQRKVDPAEAVGIVWDYMNEKGGARNEREFFVKNTMGGIERAIRTGDKL